MPQGSPELPSLQQQRKAVDVDMPLPPAQELGQFWVAQLRRNPQHLLTGGTEVQHGLAARRV
jgi:hypothetical protein